MKGVNGLIALRGAHQYHDTIATCQLQEHLRLQPTADPGMLLAQRRCGNIVGLLPLSSLPFLPADGAELTAVIELMKRFGGLTIIHVRVAHVNAKA